MSTNGRTQAYNSRPKTHHSCDCIPKAGSAARRAEKEEREREREHEHKRRQLRRLIIDNETPKKKRFFVTAAETEETQNLNRGSKISLMPSRLPCP